MASYGDCHFTEKSTSDTPRSVSSTDPNVRLRASGGEVITAAQTPRTARIPIYCTTAELEALRQALIRGELQTLTLDDETIPDAFLSEIGEPVDIFYRGEWEVTLSFEVATRVDTVHLLVWLNGEVISDAISVQTDCGRSTRFAKATVTCATRHAGERGQLVRIEGGIGDDLQTIFEGFVESVAAQFYPGEWTLVATGLLKYAQRQGDTDIDYTGFTDGAMVDNLLERRGVIDGKRDISDDGWTLGTKAKVVVRKGETWLSWIDRVDEVSRYRTYENQAGTVVRRRDDPFEVGSSTATLTEGENVLSLTFGDQVDAIRNDVKITGISHNGVQYEGSAQATSATLDDMMPESAPNYQSAAYNTALVETNTRAATYAARILADLAPLQIALTLTVPLDPALDVDQTVTINAPTFGFTGLVAMIRNVKHQIDGEGGTTAIEVNTGNFNEL